MLRSTASNVATTTGDLPKIITNQSGKLARESLACEIPIPSAAASPTMEVLRNVIFCDVISFIPVMAMDAKTDTVAPPSTQYGIVVKRDENFGITPAINRISAAPPSTQRLITFVVATIPTFWLYVAVGSPPRRENRILEIPYPTIPPAVPDLLAYDSFLRWLWRKSRRLPEWS